MPRRSTRRRSSSDGGDDADGAGAAPAEPARRVSSRATKFASSMQEPKDNLRDILPPATPEVGKKARAANKKRRTTREASDDDEDDSDVEEMMVDNSSDDDESAAKKRSSSRSSRAAAAASSRGTSSRGRGRGAGTGRRAPPQSPFKSPAKRHSTRRRTVRTEVIVEESSEEESDLESEDESAGGSGAEEGDEELDELKIQRIIASRTETRRRWREICSRMNTSEIENGSRWFQDWAATEGTADDDGVFEERFLVKWSDLSYLHCSWESQDDLVAQVDNAKSYLTTFFRKSVNGLLFDADERGDGEFFDPSYVQIERVLEIAEEDDDEDDEDADGAAAGAEEDTANKLPHGIIMDKDHPDYESGTGRQFLIKWGNTQYSDSTYEFERDLILAEADYEEHVKAFEARSAKPTKKEMTKVFKHQEEQRRRLYKIFGEKGVKGSQEDKIAEYQKKMEAHVFANGGQVRDYQAEGISWMISNYINNRSSILADEMGLGKTIQTAVFINTLATELGRTGPFLIVAPLSTIPHWYREFSGWTNLNTIVYHGSAKDRDYIREFEMPYHEDKPDSVPMNSQYLKKCHKRNAAKWERTWMVDVLITTPEMLVTDDFAELTAIKWDALVVDEAHRLKNHSSKLAQNLRDDRFNFDTILLLTGTPIQNNMQEMWTLLNIVDPDGFDDLDGFLERYGDIKSKDRVDELHETIRPYILRRLKEDVEKSVPPKEETLIEVELTVLQKQYYRALYEKNVQFLHRNQKKALDGPSIDNLAIQLRKCCNHPFLLNGVEEEVRAAENVADDKKAEADFLVRASGKLVLLDKLLPKLKEDGHRVLIFSQFKIMLDILEDYLELRGMKHERIDGSITGKKRQMAIDRFQAKETEGKESSFVMLLSTRAGGVGINLTAADTCIIFDSDWNPQNDLQAQARCHRIGQTKSVKVYRLLTRKTYEMQMFHQSSLKMGLDQAVLQGIEGGTGDGEGVLSKEEVERLLRHGAYDIFNEEKSGSSEQESKEFESQDIDSILARRAKTVVHDNTGSKSNAAGGTFSKASFRAQNTGKSGDGTGNGDDTGEDVDIDDPDFWKKMVGEAQVDESDNLHGKKRRRKQANYSEKDYDKVLRKSLMFGGGNDSDSSGADDDQSVSSEGSESDAVIDEDDDFEFGPGEITNEGLAALRDEKKALTHARERHKWGGKGKGDWSRKDCEAMLDQLKDHGYGNLPWEDSFAQITFANANGLDKDEVQLMCWSFCLSALRETAEEMVRQDARTAARRAEKKRESGDGIAPVSADGTADDAAAASDAAATASDDGGVLGSAKEPSEADVAEAKEKLDNAFNKLWQENSTWASKVLRDAIAYAKSHSPRREAQLHELFAPHAERSSKKPLPRLTTAFNENIWPSLQSRGWKDEPLVDKGTRFVSPPRKYVFKEKTYKTIGAVLDAATIIHPELAKAIETIISAAKKDAADARSNNEKEESSIVEMVSGFDVSKTTVENIEFLMRHFAPPQLLADRENDNRYKMGKRFTNLMLNSNTAHDIVSRAQSKAKQGVTDEANVVPHKDLINNLAKLITLDKRTAVPHPKWTAIHDAVLIAAIAKHGWIDRDSACKAMVEDKSIKRGRPFDGGDFGPLKDSINKDEPIDTDTKMSDPQPSSDKSAEEKGNDEESSIVSDLKSIAPRVLNFFQNEKSLLVDLKGFDQDLVARTYGLVKEDDGPEDGDFVKEAPPSWRFDETLLSAAKSKVVKSTNGQKADEEDDEVSDELSDLPSRKELRRRAKSIVKFVLATSTGSASSSTLAVDPAAAVKQGEDKEGDASTDAALSTTEQEFRRIDQMDKRNIFLVELLNAIIKLSTKVSAHKQITKKLLQYALKEVDCYIEGYAQVPEPNRVEDFRKIKSHIDLVKKTIQKHHRQGKNVLRVMLGIDAIAAKKGNEGLFPVVPKYGNIPAISSKKKQSKSKSSTGGAKNVGTSDSMASSARKKRKKKTQLLESYDSALGDVAINRALSLGMEMDPALIGSDSKALKLSSIETLILSVICSQGLPAYTENWEALIDQNFNLVSQSLPGQEFVINWFRMGGVVLNAADVWATIAHRNYEAKLLEIQANAANNSSEADLSELRTQARQLEVDLKRKENAKVEATELRDNPHQLAQRTIMMLAALQEKMGSIDTKSKKPSNEVENGLGTKVLHWLSHELSNWARALQVADQVSEKPHAAVGYDYDKNDDAEKVAAVFDKRGCRTVFLQVAQQTRLRSLFVRNGASKVAEHLPHAVVLSESAGDDWDYRPSWWVCNTDSDDPAMLVMDDADLLNGILDYGYSGFDEMVKMTDSFKKRCEQSEGDGDIFTRATVQDRINHLTRELHELDGAINVQQLLSERKATASAKKESSVQAGINSFFIAKGKTTISPKKMGNASSGADIIEIDDGDGNTNSGIKRSADATSLDTSPASPEKKQKMDQDL